MSEAKDLLASEPTVTITREEYRRLVRASIGYETLKDAIANAMHKTAYGPGVDLDNTVIPVFRALCPTDYDEILASWENGNVDA